MSQANVIDYGKTKIKAAGFIGPISAPGAAVDPIAVTWTTANPNITPDGAITIANGGTPTVAELQQFCVELNAKIAALSAKIG